MMQFGVFKLAPESWLVQASSQVGERSHSSCSSSRGSLTPMDGSTAHPPKRSLRAYAKKRENSAEVRVSDDADLRGQKGNGKDMRHQHR